MHHVSNDKTVAGVGVQINAPYDYSSPKLRIGRDPYLRWLYSVICCFSKEYPEGMRITRHLALSHLLFEAKAYHSTNTAVICVYHLLMFNLRFVKLLEHKIRYPNKF